MRDGASTGFGLIHDPTDGWQASLAHRFHLACPRLDDHA
jgi:hypothetical protein